METIGIDVMAHGAEATLEKLKEIERVGGRLSKKKLDLLVGNSIREARQELHRLANEKVRIRFEHNKEIARIQAEINRLKDQKINLKFEYNSELQRIQSSLNELQSKKLKFQMDFSQAQKDLNKYTSMIETDGVKAAKEAFPNVAKYINKGMLGVGEKGAFVNFDKVQQHMFDKFGSKITDLQNQAKDLKLKYNIDTSEIDKELAKWKSKMRDEEITYKANVSDITQKEQGIRSSMTALRDYVANMQLTPRMNASQVYRTIRDIQMRLGSAMQSIGNGIARLTSPVDTFMRGTLYAGAYRALNAVSEGLSGSFQRYDIMERYPDIIKAMGGSAKTAAGEIQKMYKAVLGLPTGLDTIVDAQKQYYLALQGSYKDQDKALKRSSEIAIAANNAFVAGGASEEQVIFGQRQLRDLLSAGKLRNQEWQSLAKAIPNAMSAIQKDLGVTRSDIMSGKVSADEFVNSLVKVSSQGGPVAQAAERMKHSWTAVGANIRNALRNAGYETLKTLDGIFKEYNGGDLIDQALGIKPFIQGLAKDIQDWAKANPDKIIAFFEKLQSLDIKGFLSGVAGAFQTIGKFVSGFMEAFSFIDGAFLGKFMIYSNLFGKVLRGFGGIIRGTAAPSAGLITGLLMLGKGIGKFIKSTETAGKIANLGFVNKIKTFFDRFKGVEKSAKAVESTSAALTTVGSSSGTFATSLKTLGTNLLKAATPAILIAGYAGAFFAVAKVLEKIGKMKIDTVNAGKNMLKVAVAIGVMSKSMSLLVGSADVVTSVRGAVTKLVGGLSAIISAGVFWAVAEILNQIQKVDLDIGKLQSNIGNMLLAITELTAFTTALGGLQSLGGFVGLALQAIGSLSTLLTAGTWVAVTKALDKIGKLKVPSTEKISSVHTALSTLTEKLLSKGVWATFKDSLKASDYKSTMEDLSVAMDSIYSIFNNVDKSMDKLISIADKGLAKEKIQEVSDKIRGLKDAFAPIFEAVSEMLNREGERNISRSYKDAGDTELSDLKEYADMLEALVGTLGQLSLISGKLKAIRTSLNNLLGTYGDGNTHNTRLDTSAISADISSIVGIIDTITGNSMLGKLKSATDRMEGVDLENINAQLGKIPKVLNTLNQLKTALAGQDWVKAVGQTPEFANPMTGGLGFGSEGAITQKNVYGEEVTGFFDTIKSMIDLVVKIANEINRVPDITDKVTTLQNAINGIKKAVGMMSQLRAVANADQSMSKEKGSVDIATYISDFITKLNVALMGSSVLLVNAGLFKLAMMLIQSALNSVVVGNGNGGGINGFLTALGKIPGALQKVSAAMNGKGAEWKRQLVDGFKGTKQKILSEVNGIAASLYSAGSFYSAGSSAGSRWASGFNSAASRISVPSIPSLPFSTGGLVSPNGVQYRAKGGQLFKKKGTDTVPAMLTPGEYVIKKDAVKNVGLPFLQRINHLDIKGAIASLGLRGGQLAYATPNVTIDRSKHVTYNNNQQLTLNNNNASQEYSEFRASRYLRRM